jgi:hypothetical protein
MVAMMNMNSGYSGWSMSLRACDAYADGEMPKSKWTKAAMVAAINEWCDEQGRTPTIDVTKLKKDELFTRFFICSSWHHTSKFCNATDFYSIDECELEDYSRPASSEELQEREEARAARLREEAEKNREYSKWLAAYKKEEEEFNARKEAYKKHYGFAVHSPLAFEQAYPEQVKRRVSKKGNVVLEIGGKEYAGDALYNGYVYEKGTSTEEILERAGF